MIGTTLGKYQVVELVGKGGMAEVYRAYHPDLDRFVAIKVMHPFLTAEESFSERFRHEARSIARLRHPNIVQLHDFNTEGDITYMVMEFIPGSSLKDMLTELEREGRWLSLEKAARIIRDIGEALDYAHQRDMIHRDVKPANIMFGEDGTAILTDFGIVKMLSARDASGLTASGALIGTPAYMAPEQCMGTPGDERTDIYALGIVLYQLTTKRLPFDADTPMAIVFKHVNETLPIPSGLNPDLPTGLERVILKALAKEPDDRYQSVREMLGQLDRAMRGEKIPPVDPSITTASLPMPDAAPPTRRRPRWRTAFIGLILAGALAIIGFLATSGRREPTPTPEPLEVAVATATSTVTPSPSFTPKPTATATPPPSATPKPSATPEPTPSDTPAPSPTHTETPTPPPTYTAAPSPTHTETPLPTFGVGSPATALRNANVYSTNDSSTAPLALVRAGENVTVLGRYGNWLNVRAENDAIGWVYQPDWFELSGDIGVLPTVIPPPTNTPTFTAPSCATGSLTLSLWDIPGSEQCLPGGRWSVEIQYIAGGGNCVYAYFWQGVQVYGPTTDNEFVYRVEWGDAALTGTGKVESGGEPVQHDLHVPKPSWCP